MPILSKPELTGLVGNPAASPNFRKAITDTAINEIVDKNTRYDVLLSHSYLDHDTIEQINALLEDEYGLSVFVDWIEKPSHP